MYGAEHVRRGARRHVSPGASISSLLAGDLLLLQEACLTGVRLHADCRRQVTRRPAGPTDFGPDTGPDRRPAGRTGSDLGPDLGPDPGPDAGPGPGPDAGPGRSRAADR